MTGREERTALLINGPPGSYSPPCDAASASPPSIQPLSPVHRKTRIKLPKAPSPSSVWQSLDVYQSMAAGTAPSTSVGKDGFVMRLKTEVVVVVVVVVSVARNPCRINEVSYTTLGEDV
jgi:hypothetical protein